MLNHLEPYLLAPSSLTPTALLERAGRLLDDPAVRAEAAVLTPDSPAVLVRDNPLYDAWLVHWEGGDSAGDGGFHTHDGAHGAYAVVSGVFRETSATADGVRERLVVAGERVAYRPGYAHRLEPVGGTAVAVHLTSPPRALPRRPAPTERAQGCFRLGLVPVGLAHS